MYTDSEIKKKSLFLLGNDINKLDEETKESLNVNYEDIIIKSLSKYRWRFARRTEEIEGEEIENNKYKYQSNLPSNFICLINIFTDIKETNINNDYNLTDKIYTNIKKNYVKYIKRLTTSKLPIYFVEYLIYELASEWCYNLTGDSDLLQLLETKKKEKFEIACNIDSRQGQPYVPLYNPFNDIR